MPRFHCMSMAQPYARVLKPQWKRGIYNFKKPSGFKFPYTLNRTLNIQKIDKKRAINKETSQNFLGFVQWILGCWVIGLLDSMQRKMRAPGS